MKITNKFLIGLCALGLTMPLIAEKKTTKATAATTHMDAALERAMQLTKPGPNHQTLNPLVGKWTCTVRGWMKPGDEPQESQGTSEVTWIFGGRFLKQEFKGNWAGQSFEGIGYTGYDNLRSEYQSIWLDNMATGFMQSTGNFDATNRVLNLRGEFSHAMTNEKHRYIRSELKIIDNDNNSYTSYFKDKDGREYKAMEIIYKRAG